VASLLDGGFNLQLMPVVGFSRTQTGVKPTQNLSPNLLED